MSRMSDIYFYKILAQKALDVFGIKNCRIKFIQFAGNSLFRVYEKSPKTNIDRDDPFLNGQYLIRIHDKIEQKTDAIELEMEWLKSMRDKSALPIPEPICTPKGNLVVQVSTSKFQDKRDCTVLKWLKGRHITKNIKPHHYFAQGKIMAQLHNHSAAYPVRLNTSKRRFDYKGLFIDDAGANFPNSKAWSFLPEKQKEAYEIVAQRVKKQMKIWGKNPEVFGLIHGDCGVDANVLFHRGNAHIIDFDGSGFGYYLYDLALALEHCWNDPNYDQFQKALIMGYREHRKLSENQIKYIELFRAAFYVYMGLWTLAIDQTFPDSKSRKSRHDKWLGYGYRFIKKYLNNS
ncbi:MAG: phosphotransferase [Candidatus Zixiibacteriota bacterium]